MISFAVFGDAKPAGSKRAMPIYRNGPFGKVLATRANGSPMIAVCDANPKSRDWKNAVASAAREAYDGELLDGPLVVTMSFYRPRPKGHFGKVGLSKAGRESTAPISKPDVLKLARGVEDALTGVIYRDDSQIVHETLIKTWGEPARCEIVVREAMLMVDPVTGAFEYGAQIGSLADGTPIVGSVCKSIASVPTNR